MSKSKKNRPRRSKSYSKYRGVDKKSHVVHMFIEMLNVVKLYHWKTHSFPEHKSTDELYSQLNEHIDKFVEVLLGKDASRIKKWESKMNIIQADNSKQFKDRIYEYREFLIDLNRFFDAKRDSDLLNIRDEILGDINQFLYLMSFH
jgi:DNA-binding ferritin-like protein